MLSQPTPATSSNKARAFAASVARFTFRSTVKLTALSTLAVTAALLPACTQPPMHAYWDMPPFGADDVALYHALESSCTKFKNQPASRAVGDNPKFGTYGQWQSICQEALNATPDATTLILAQRTRQVEMPGPGKFTGYFKPMLAASHTRTATYNTPLIAKPADLTVCPTRTVTITVTPTATIAPAAGPEAIPSTSSLPTEFPNSLPTELPSATTPLAEAPVSNTVASLTPVTTTQTLPGGTGQMKPDGTCVTPYPTRSEIEANLPNYEVLAWLKDPVDAYFLHIQGSGTLLFEDKTTAHIGFAGKNGHPYVSIGKVLKDMGEVEGTITADTIRDWLKANPERANEVLHANPSFIFFNMHEEESPGAYGVTLTPGRSLAVDKSAIPLGVPVRVETTLSTTGESFDRLMFAHDIGSAIKGPSRGDIYFGHGPAAGKAAGHQNAPGKLYVLVPRDSLAAK